MKPPPLVPQMHRQVNVQVVPKTEIANVTAQARSKLMRACAEIMEAQVPVNNTRNVVLSSCESFKKISLIGTNLDRELIAGENELAQLDALLAHLREIAAAIEVALEPK